MKALFFILIFCSLSLSCFSDNATDIAVNESIVTGSVESITYTREPAKEVQSDSKIFFPSCGTEIIEFNVDKRLSGVQVPNKIRILSPLGEFCTSLLKINLHPSDVLISTLNQNSHFEVNWHTYIIFNDDNEEVIFWTTELEEKYGDLVNKKYWCSEEEEIEAAEDADPQECFEVKLSEFSKILDK